MVLVQCFQLLSSELAKICLMSLIKAFAMECCFFRHYLETLRKLDQSRHRLAVGRMKPDWVTCLFKVLILCISALDCTNKYRGLPLGLPSYFPSTCMVIIVISTCLRSELIDHYKR